MVKNDGPEAEKRLVRELQLHFACHNHPCVAKIMGLFQVLDDPLGPGCALLLPCSESLFDQVRADIAACYSGKLLGISICY